MIYRTAYTSTYKQQPFRKLHGEILAACLKISSILK